MPTMIYHSPFTRLFLAVVGLIAGSLLAFGGTAKWRATPSLQWLERFPLPLQVWGVAFIVYAALLLFAATRPAGYALGAGLFAVFALSLFATLWDDGPKNAVAVAALADVVVFHIYSIRTAWSLRLAG